MTRKLGWILLTLAACVSASAAATPGSISGLVRNSGGVPQMGAAVEIIAAATVPAVTVYTDEKGQYSAKGLLPGLYTVKVSAPSFLPSIRERVGLVSGASLVVNVTLNTLFEAIQLVPKRSHSSEDQDDWRWTLRSGANRPILRLADSGPLVVVRNTEDAQEGTLKAKVAFMAGSSSEAFSGAGMSTNFQIEQSLFSSGTLGVVGNVGYGDGVPAMFRASYSQKMPNGSKPEISITAKRLATPDVMQRQAALQALAMSVSDSMIFNNSLELSYGSETQAVQFTGNAVAVRPFGSADWHLGENTVLGYRYASSVPNMRRVKGFETAPADLSETGPRISLVNNDLALERVGHHEISVSRRFGKDNSVQLATFHDQVRNAALTGVGFDFGESEIVPDIYSGTFLYNGGSYQTNGIRAVYQRKLFADATATIDYSYGGVLTAPDGMTSLADVRNNLSTVNRHSLATKFNGTIEPTKTRLLASYRWTSGEALTPVDQFNASPGQADPYLSIFIRQPLPRKIAPAGMEALVDVRNLLAQGYRPVMSNDGNTLYLVQVARSVRGGVAFTF